MQSWARCCGGSVGNRNDDHELIMNSADLIVKTRPAPAGKEKSCFREIMHVVQIQSACRLIET